MIGQPITLPPADRPVGRKVSVVVATYKSEKFVEELVHRILAVFERRGETCEIVLVDDGSPDGTWALLRGIHARHPGSVKIVKLLKNAGQHNALLCGFQYATGDVVVTMDDDLQHPPEEIPKLLDKLLEGEDLVIGAYDQKQHARYRNLAGRIIDGVIRHIYGLDSKLELTSFRAVRRALIDVAGRTRSPYPYITCILLDQATRVSNVLVTHAVRREGTTGYSLKRSLVVAANLLISYSSVPLYITAAFCLIAAAFTAVMLGWVIVVMLASSITVPGWASVIVILTLFATFTLLSQFVMGLYIARIHHQLVGRRVAFTVDKRHG